MLLYSGNNTVSVSTTNHFRIDSGNPDLLLHAFVQGVQGGRYHENVGAGHFCPPLTVAREFRLCLRPGGTLRVQSLHLPRTGLGSA